MGLLEGALILGFAGAVGWLGFLVGASREPAPGARLVDADAYDEFLSYTQVKGKLENGENYHRGVSRRLREGHLALKKAEVTLRCKDREIEALAGTVESLQRQLAGKDGQIDALHKSKWSPQSHDPIWFGSTTA